MFVSLCLSPSPPQLFDGDKKQSDFSCMDARKAVYYYAGDPRKKIRCNCPLL